MKYSRPLFLILIGFIFIASSYQDIRYISERNHYEIKTKLGLFLGTLLISNGLIVNINKLDRKNAIILFFLGIILYSYGNSQLSRGHMFPNSPILRDYGIMSGSISSFILFFLGFNIISMVLSIKIMEVSTENSTIIKVVTPAT